MTEALLKLLAVDFLKMVVAGRVGDAFRKYVSKDLIHHNAYFKGDRQSLMAAMEEDFTDLPGKIFIPYNVLQDGDKVAVHSHIRFDQEDPGYAIVHIFRFEGNLIAEMWDIGQAIPEDPVNELGMF